MATDLSSYLIRSFTHYKRKAHTSTSLVQRGVQQLIFQPQDKPELQEVIPTWVDSRFVKGHSENITICKDLSQQFSLEVRKEGPALSQVVSVSKHAATIYQVKFVGSINDQGEVTLQERVPAKLGDPNVFARNEIPNIFYEPGIPDWYRITSIESLCVLETQPDGTNPPLAILYPNFCNISFSSKVDTVLEIEDQQEVLQKILPLLSICKGMLSFIKDESELANESLIPERCTVQALFMWKSTELLLTKLAQIHSKFDPKNPLQTVSEASVASIVAELKSLVPTTGLSFFDTFLQPFQASIGRCITSGLESSKEDIYGEAAEVLSNIQQGFEVLRTGLTGDLNLATLRSLVAETKAYFPGSDSCFDRILRVWLSDGSTHIDPELWGFVASQYRYLLELNKKAKPLSAYPLTTLLNTAIFSRSEGLCSVVVATINNTQRTRTDLMMDLFPLSASEATNREFLKMYEKPVVDEGGFFFNGGNISATYGNWMVKWSSKTAIAFNSVTLQKIKLIPPTDAQLSLIDQGNLIVGQNTTQGQPGVHTTAISWFDFRQLADVKDPSITQLAFSRHPIELDGTVTKVIPGQDGYVLCEVPRAIGSRMCLRLKLGESNDEITQAEEPLFRTKILYFYKGRYLVSIADEFEGNRYLAQSTGKPQMASLNLVHITSDMEVRDADIIEVELMPDLGQLGGSHGLATTSNSGHFYSRFQFFSRDSTVYMLLLNVALTTKFTLWRLKRDTKFEFVTHFDGVSRQLSRYQRKHQLGIMDVTGWVNHTSRRNPLCLLMLLIDSEDLKQPQRGAVCRSTHGGVRIRSVKIDLRHF